VSFHTAKGSHFCQCPKKRSGVQEEPALGVERGCRDGASGDERLPVLRSAITA